MKERGILYSAPMVRAKLAGTKTQTRRIINRVRGFAGKIRQFEQSTTPGYDYSFRDRRGLWQDFRRADLLKLCPYGEPGDRLWGRETFHECVDEETLEFVRYGYRADGDWDGAVWSPSIHMPRSASRIFDEIIEIRVERLRDISESDAKAEGMECVLSTEYCESEHTSDMLYTYRAGFIDYLKNHGHMEWAANPWVWVIVTKPILPAPSAAGR